jgi:hypothetical protein
MSNHCRHQACTIRFFIHQFPGKAFTEFVSQNLSLKRVKNVTKCAQTESILAKNISHVSSGNQLEPEKRLRIDASAPSGSLRQQTVRKLIGKTGK